VFFAAVLFFGIVTLWVEARWALTIFQVALLALATASAVKRLPSGLPIGHHPVGLLLAGAVAWGLIQVTFGQTVYPLRTLETTLDWTVNLVAFSLALELGRRAKERERFLESALVFAAVLSLSAIFTRLTSPAGKVFWVFDSSADIATLGPFVYRNQYAAFVEVVLPVAIFRAIRNRRRWLPYTLIAALLFGSVVASGSRGGTALCFFEILIVPVIAFAQNRFDGAGLARVLIGNLSLVGVLVVIVGWQALWMRFEEPHPYALRRDLAESSLQMLHDRPWIGFGLGTWSSAYPGYARYDDGTFVNQAHNDWVQWAAEGGVPFLMIMLGTAGWTIRPAVRAVWGVGVLAVFLHAVVDYPFQQRPALAAFVFALLGLLAAEERSSVAAPQAAPEPPADPNRTVFG
jgi:O-antigen ligase